MNYSWIKKEICLLNKNFSTHVDSQVGVPCIAFEQSHLTLDKNEISSSFAKNGKWLKSQGLEFLIHVV